MRFRLWWRRRIFYLRQRSPLLIVLFLICLLLICILVPNPFSARYKPRALNQDVQWQNIHELLQVKERVLDNQLLPSDIKVVKPGHEELSSSSPILIVLYTTVFHEKKFCSIAADRIFGASCPVKDRCQWSCDEQRIHEADAIIFHAFDIIYHRLALPKRSETKPGAVWILWSDEPPSIVNYDRLNSYQFNWTISYKFNSEISLGAYGLFSKRTNPLSDEEYDQWITSEFSNRTNGAIWFVSNCRAKTRLKLYADLKQLSNVPIEGYGRCVDHYPLHWCAPYSQCQADYMSTFKFHFSFESNTCRDYITEKFYKAFYYNLIPIVYGPAVDDYEHVAPKDSFIHIDRFDQDATKLAAFLGEVHRNRTLFSKYHQWRRNYQVIIEGKALERIRMCELCHRLSRLRRGETVYYRNIEKFYSDQCSYS